MTTPPQDLSQVEGATDGQRIARLELAASIASNRMTAIETSLDESKERQVRILDRLTGWKRSDILFILGVITIIIVVLIANNAFPFS